MEKAEIEQIVTILEGIKKEELGQILKKLTEILAYYKYMYGEIDPIPESQEPELENEKEGIGSDQR
jgi:hypothetical protein